MASSAIFKSIRTVFESFSMFFTVLLVRLFFALVFLTTSAYASDEKDIVILPSVVVSAARIPQFLQDVLPSTSLITRAQIQNSQAIDLPSLLRREVGIEILQSGGIGTVSSLQMRGASSAQVLVLLDGVEISAVSNGSAQLAQIMTSQIDHIEIVRGNVSALYGSPAVGGVVRIFTQPDHATDDAKTASSRTRVSTHYGAAQTRGAQASYARRVDQNTLVNFSIDRQLSDSFPTLNAQQAPNANQNDHGYQNTSFSGQIQRTFSSDWEGGVRLFQSEAITHFSNKWGMPTDTNTALSALRNIAIFANGQAGERWQVKFNLARSEDENNSHTVTALSMPTSSLFKTVNDKFIFENSIPWLRSSSQTQTTLFGYEYLRQELHSNYYGAPSRRVDAVFLGQQMRMDRHQVQVNMRHDRYSDFGHANNYFLGYAYSLTPALKSYLNFSNAFRAPTFNDLYFPGYSNAQLQPERARSIEGGVRYQQADNTVQLALFQTAYHDLINYVLVDPVNHRSMPFNTQRAQVEGLELSLSTHRQGGLLMQANLTLQNPINQSSGAILPSRARQFGYVSVDKKWENVYMGAELHASGARFDQTMQTWLAGYSVTNLMARYTMTKEWTLATKIENIFNRDYQTVAGYNTPRRGLYLTLTWQAH